MSISTEKQITNTNPCTTDSAGLFVEPVTCVNPLVLDKAPCPCQSSDPLGQKDKPSSYEELLGYGVQVPTPVVIEP